MGWWGSAEQGTARRKFRSACPSLLQVQDLSLSIALLGFGKGRFVSFSLFFIVVFLTITLKAGTKISAGSLVTCDSHSLHVSVDR